MWRFSQTDSHWLGPVPKDWIQELDASEDRIRVHERVVAIDGTLTTVEVDAAFDGAEYTVSGSRLVDTIAYSRPDSFRIEGTARKSGSIVFSEVVEVSQDLTTLTMTVSFRGGASNGIAVFRKAHPELP